MADKYLSNADANAILRAIGPKPTLTYDESGGLLFHGIRIVPSGLDSREKWDASGRPYFSGEPTRVMDKLSKDRS